MASWRRKSPQAPPHRPSGPWCSRVPASLSADVRVLGEHSAARVPQMSLGRGLVPTEQLKRLQQGALGTPMASGPEPRPAVPAPQGGMRLPLLPPLERKLPSSGAVSCELIDTRRAGLRGWCWSAVWLSPLTGVHGGQAFTANTFKDPWHPRPPSFQKNQPPASLSTRPQRAPVQDRITPPPVAGGGRGRGQRAERRVGWRGAHSRAPGR